MSASEVGSGQVAIFPTFKGFRKAITSETDGAAKASSTGFRKAFSKTGDDSGRTVGTGFKKAFEKSAKGTSDKELKALQDNVAKTSRALSTARLKQQDLAGKVRIAEVKLAEAQERHAAGSSQVVTAMERLKSATRQLNQANEVTENSTKDLREAQTKLAAAADASGGKMSGAGARWGTKFRSGFRSVFGGAFLGTLASNLISGLGNAVQSGIQDLKQLVVDSIGAASDLEQSLGAVDAVFGDYAASVHKQAQAAARDVGLSQNAYNSLATVVGAQLKNLGIPLDQVSEKTDNLVGLGADLAAQFGGTTQTAIEAISALLRGERDPIERYGVSFNEAAVKAEAFSLGIVKTTKDLDKIKAAQARAEVAQRKYNDAVRKYGKESTQALSASATLTSANSSLNKALAGTTGELTNQQKAAATLSLLYKQTADAQGTFSRESDTLAHKQQVQAALWQDVQAKIGTAFLPVASELADILSDDVIPAISELVDKYGPELGQAFQDALPSIKGMVEDLLPRLPGLLESFANVLPTIVQGLQAIGPPLIFLAQLTSGWHSSLGSLFALLTGDVSVDEFMARLQKIPGPIGAIITAAVNLGTGFGKGVRAAVDWTISLATTVQRKVGEIVGFFQSIPTRVGTFFANAGTWLVNAGKNVVQGLINGITSKVDEVISTARNLADRAVSTVLKALGINSPSKVFRDIGRFVGEGFIQGLKGSESKVQSAAKSMISKIRAGTDAKVISSTAGNAVIRAINATTKRITAALAQRQKVLDKLADAQKQLADLVKERADFVAGVSSSITALGDISEFRSVNGMVANLAKQVEATKQFREILDELTKLGLDATSRDQLLQKFLQTGSAATAKALLAGGKDAVQQVADLQKQLTAQGTALGTTVGDQMYNAGINAARGLVAGLQSQASALTKAVAKLADDLVRTVKKKLKISSPSRVFAEIGRFTVDGLTGGIEDRAPVARRAILKAIPDTGALRTAAAVMSSMTSTATTQAARPSSVTGDTFVFQGVTTDTAAAEIGDVIEKKKRRRVRASGALVVAGVA